MLPRFTWRLRYIRIEPFISLTAFVLFLVSLGLCMEFESEEMKRARKHGEEMARLSHILLDRDVSPEEADSFGQMCAQEEFHKSTVSEDDRLFLRSAVESGKICELIADCMSSSPVLVRAARRALESDDPEMSEALLDAENPWRSPLDRLILDEVQRTANQSFDPRTADPKDLLSPEDACRVISLAIEEGVLPANEAVGPLLVGLVLRELVGELGLRDWDKVVK